MNRIDPEKYVTQPCEIWGEYHIMNYDPTHSDVTKSMFSCSCGAQVQENEDGVGG